MHYEHDFNTMNITDRRDAYGQAALKGECDEIATTPEGRRNGQLFRSACRLFRLANGGTLTESDVRGLCIPPPAPPASTKTRSRRRSRAPTRRTSRMLKKPTGGSDLY